jgi:hypothetical protein
MWVFENRIIGHYLIPKGDAKQSDVQYSQEYSVIGNKNKYLTTFIAYYLCTNN